MSVSFWVATWSKDNFESLDEEKLVCGTYMFFYQEEEEFTDLVLTVSTQGCCGIFGIRCSPSLGCSECSLNGQIHSLRLYSRKKSTVDCTLMFISNNL